MFLRERIAPVQIAGLALGAAGLSWPALARVEGFSAFGFVICLGAAIGQAGANFLQRAARGASAPSLMTWTSIAPSPALSLLFEGPAAMVAAVTGASAAGWLSMIYKAFGLTAPGYAICGAMLAKLPAAQVAPFALPAPIFRLLGGAVILGEKVGAAALAGAAVMIAGLALTAAGPSVALRLRR